MCRVLIDRTFRKVIFWAPVLILVSVFGNLGSVALANVTLPQVNLGGSSIQDGVAGPGFLFQETLSSYQSNEFLADQGQLILGDNEIETFLAQSHLAFISTKKILGGFYGAEVLLPYVSVKLATDFGINTKVSRLGDLTVSPLLIQWHDTTLFGRKYWQRLALSFSLPTGSYDENEPVNIGNNFTTFNPHYAFTLEASDKWEISGRVHYLFNSKNKSPAPSVAQKSTQAGHAIHVNFASSYAIADNWRLGFSGYYLKQISDDKIDGSSLRNSREQVLALGPVAQFSYNGHFVYLNYFNETSVENRSKGSSFSVRYSKVW